MNNQQAILTALGCAGSLAAVLAVSRPAIASPTTTGSLPTTSPTALSQETLSYTTPDLGPSESDPITDALSCTCATCSMGEQRPIL